MGAERSSRLSLTFTDEPVDREPEANGLRRQTRCDLLVQVDGVLD